MKIGAERKKVMILAGLLVTAAVVFYINSSGSSQPGYATSATASSGGQGLVPPVLTAPASSAPKPDRRLAARPTTGEVKWRLGVRDPKERPNPSSIDPTLRLDLLAKVQSVEIGGGGRNIFLTGAPEVKAPPLPKNVPTIRVNAPPPPPVQVAQGPPPPPQAPPMTFKYYGYKVSKADGHKSAFLLDGEDILITGENETFKQRYRVVKIGVNSITVEDIQFKQQQTLPLQESVAG